VAIEREHRAAADCASLVPEPVARLEVSEEASRSSGSSAKKKLPRSSSGFLLG
jgi:hypothetical protein